MPNPIDQAYSHQTVLPTPWNIVIDPIEYVNKRLKQTVKKIEKTKIDQFGGFGVFYEIQIRKITGTKCG
jgi:hypothetical protein